MSNTDTTEPAQNDLPVGIDELRIELVLRRPDPVNTDGSPVGDIIKSLEAALNDPDHEMGELVNMLTEVLGFDPTISFTRVLSSVDVEGPSDYGRISDGVEGYEHTPGEQLTEVPQPVEAPEAPAGDSVTTSPGPVDPAPEENPEPDGGVTAETPEPDDAPNPEAAQAEAPPTDPELMASEDTSEAGNPAPVSAPIDPPAENQPSEENPMTLDEAIAAARDGKFVKEAVSV